MQPSQVVIVSQPGSGPPVQTSNWHTGLCDCFTDCEVCLCGTFCIECLACQVAGDMNECCLCGTSVAMRTHYRTKYGIPGSICDDCLVTHCCLPCSLCQMKRDIKRRIAMRTF
ncbi:placenta-specific gene 8 protein-like [Trichechus manatus latirostris]|uniref:Placenta-specific gene 8 protein-like n=1 Tax=Trichechus manatus latirostris TaxID=127582 RepID=A0A2Y9DXN2_TRIMA|nr:placenta-specific gene 8 protein-like [Trichechus manatus latirostris]